MFRRNKNPIPQPEAPLAEERVSEQTVGDSPEVVAAKAEEKRIKNNLREVAIAPREQYEGVNRKAQELSVEDDRLKQAHSHYTNLQEKIIEARSLHDTEAERELSLQMRDTQVSTDGLLSELLADEISEIKKGWQTGSIPRILPGLVRRGSGGQYFTFEDVEVPKFKADMSRDALTFKPGVYIPTPEDWEYMNLSDTEVPLEKTFYGSVRGEGLPDNIDVFMDPQMTDCTLDDLQGWQTIAERAVQPAGAE